MAAGMSAPTPKRMRPFELLATSATVSIVSLLSAVDRLGSIELVQLRFELNVNGENLDVVNC